MKNKFIRIDQSDNYIYLEIGPLYISANLHINPYEKTEKAAFAIKHSVSIYVSLFDKEIFKKTIFEGQQYWGLCIRLGTEWKDK